MSDHALNLKIACGRIRSSAATERKDGLADLEHIFRHNKNNSAFGDKLDDPAWHAIFDSLFECTAVERANYLKASASQRSKSTTRATSISRMEACGRALRTTVTAGVGFIRAKTVKALLDHILQTLPTPDGNYCEGLSQPYVKCLSTICEYQPHVEHLRKNWFHVVDFCIEGIALLQDQATQPSSFHNSNGSSMLRTPTISMTRRSRDGTPQPTKIQRASTSSTEVDELILCLHHLTRATNAPVPERATPILSAIIQYLRVSGSVRTAHHFAFAAINAVLSKIGPSSVECTQKVLLELYPLIKELWQSKSTSLRDEMMITLVLTRSQILSVLSRSDCGDFALDMENLLETLQADYGRRLERDQLQLSDVQLAWKPYLGRTSFLELPALQLRGRNAHSESQWTILHLVAYYIHLLDARKNKSDGRSEQTRDKESRKRRRQSSLFDDILRQSSIGLTSSKLFALQMLSFYSSLSPLSPSQIRDILNAIIPMLADQHGPTSSWAMIALASIAFQKSAHNTDMSSIWLDLFGLASRKVATPSTCRAASLLLNVLLKLKVVSYLSVAAIVETMLSSVDLHGPAAFCDSSASLWTTFMKAKATENPSASSGLSERILRWVFGKWIPSNFDIKRYASEIAANCRPLDILNVLDVCSEREMVAASPSPFVCHGIISQAWQRAASAAPLIEYILLSKEDGDFLQQAANVERSRDTQGLRAARPSLAADMQILDLCASETERVLAKWSDWMDEKSQKLLPEMMVTVVSLCIVNDILISQQDERNKIRTDALRKSNETLNKSVTGFLTHPECEHDNVDAVLALVADYLPNIRFLQSTDDSQGATTGIIPFALHLSRALGLRRAARKSVTNTDDDDLMELDNGFDSQMSENHGGDFHEIAARDLLTMGSDMFSFRSCVTAYTQLMATLFQSKVEAIDESQNVVPPGFIGYLTSLTPSEFCACRPLLNMLLSSQTPLLTSDADLLFDHLAAEFLEIYDYERHEVTLSIALDLLRGCAGQWTDTNSESLRDSAIEAYTWFIDVALPRNLCSPDVQHGISDLFFTLLKARGPDFKPEPTLPSIRTGLFNLLATGDIPIKYHISEHIAQFFGHFTLGEHEAVFEDVRKSLPDTVGWKEGMALRLLVLSRLGSQWSTLLRRCVYHIYETAGMVKGCGGHATFCISEITNSLRLKNSQELFRLFASQLLYTWLGGCDIKDIPFSIFAYPSLRSLLVDIEDEVYAQVLMRGKDEVHIELAKLLGSTTTELLKKNFGKTEGYCLSWDANKSSQEQQSSAEARVRAMLDKNEYTALCTQHLSTVLGTFLYTVEEPQVLKMLSKRETAAQEFKMLKSMHDISASTQTLPADQQPLFHSKFLLDRIDRLARRVNINPSVLWTPAVYTFVLRMLLSRIHSALGSLHACSVVRKIRILVALSGPVALSGYPLEMTLHGLRPLLTDKQCAEDTIGIVQYLFGNGIPYLVTQISFVSGVVVSTLISLRQFVGSSQESTTQESQHRATMSKAHNFHTWLFESWMPEYTRQYGKRDAALQSCSALITAASKANEKTSPMSGKPESAVLLQLLNDRRSGSNLLKEPAWNLVFSLLCLDFDPLPCYRNDILGHDSQAISFASEVWLSCKQANVSKEYMLWAARVLGRAHNAAGLCSTFVSGQKDGGHLTDSEMNQRPSKGSILQALSNLLLSSSRTDAGLAEDTIRAVLMRTTSREAAAENLQLLAVSTISALALTTTEVGVAFRAPEVAPLDRRIADVARPVSEWLQNLTISLSYAESADPLVGALPRILAGVEHLAESLFGPVLHLVLERDHHGKQAIRRVLSEGCRELFKEVNDQTLPHVKALVSALLYLHKQPYPQEITSNDRLKWLDIDYAIAANAAEKCSMHTTALRFAEQGFPQAVNVKASRRSSVLISPASISDTLLLSIFKNIDEPDSFYGVQQQPDLSSVLDRLEYEADGFKGLLFRGARLDSQMRRHDDPSAADTSGLIRSLINLNLNALPHNLLSNQQAFASGVNMADSVLYTARKLEQWDIRAPDSSPTESSTIFKVFQGISNSRDLGAVRSCLDFGLFGTIQSLLSPIHSGRSVKSCLRTLGILTEIHDVMASTSPEYLRDAWTNMQARSEKMLSAQREDVQAVFSSRETLFGTLGNNNTLREAMHLSLKDVRSVEVETLLSSCNMSRKHSSLQDSLATATYLSDLTISCSRIGLDIKAAAQNEVADALWDQGEHSTSIRMLRRLTEIPRSKDESDQSHRSKLLAKLGHHVAEARLEQPAQIMSEYLAPAIAELGGLAQGDVAGQVFHQYASFCDAQLHNPDLNADFDRIRRMRDTRAKEMEHFKQLARTTRDKSLKDKYVKEFRKTSKWFNLDEKEYDRLRIARESFMTQSLENYLLALSASDSHDNDVLRFFALWLEFSDSELANTSVGKHLASVPTAKFVRLMNQLSSRLQSDQTAFQELLSDLVLHIAIDHPYHSMHHISAGSSSISATASESAKSRMNAARAIAGKLKAASDRETGISWHNISSTDRLYDRLAKLHDNKGSRDTAFRAGRDLALDVFPEGKALTTRIKDFKLPPPTMDIPVRYDKNYSKVPRITGFLPKMRIANGLSAPKIVVARCSDGQSFKQLFKAADDLRQDAIMEQVFEEVSKLLANHTATRQRNLRIRTYKVVPLTSNSGIMEFVQNTKAFHDVLLPLHEKHFPKDWKTSHIRVKIDAAVKEPNDTRVRIYRDVMDHFNPAMRFFFLEQYPDPDVWFEKRIAYTRSTAAISILGHVVGLGDRHLHNILLDENSGEVVHIDLGVAFEAGRVLPIPEVVPFRLSRDIVDGMGYTKTEGVFRRCCEFTLDALREEREGIMTLLNVLRYDPLYTWTVSPLKAKQLQETDDDGDAGVEGVEHQSSRKEVDDAGEAGRALTIVEKKLSKTLSTAATVSELISQAGDERHLAVLFAGWSAWV